MAAGLAIDDGEAIQQIVVNDNHRIDAEADAPEGSEADRALVKKIQERVTRDRKHHAKAFKRMRANQRLALRGATDDWSERNYTANLIGRHIAQKAATLYAKNPKAVARRRERLDFRYWDESFESLALAFQTAQTAGQVLQQMAYGVPPQGMGDPMGGVSAPAMAAGMPGGAPMAPQPPQEDFLTGSGIPGADAPPAGLGDPSLGAPGLPDPTMAPDLPGLGHNGGPGGPMPGEEMLPPGLDAAVALLQDFQTGTYARDLAERHGKTLALLFHFFLNAGSPLDVKAGLKGVVRRACVNSVGYVQLDFQRSYGPSPSVAGKLADARDTLARLQSLQEEQAKGEKGEDDPEVAETQALIAALEGEPQVPREGLTFDFPGSLHVIPDRLTQELTGFVGARWVTVERLWTPEQIKDQFGVDIGKGFKPYRQTDGVPEGGYSTDSWATEGTDILSEQTDGERKGELCAVWQHFDKQTGLVSVTCDGFPDFLQKPGKPPVKVPGFFPLYALTFNPIEHEGVLFPTSDVELLIHQQMEYNRARQGLRDHRRAAMPRWVFPKGAIDEADIELLQSQDPFEAIGLNIDTTTKIGDILQPVPVKGVDNNLYEVNQILQDFQLVAGASESQLGATGNGTATEASLAAGAQQTAQGANIDDMDSFLTRLTRDAGIILQREMSPESVERIAGPGFAWPEMSPEDLADEVALEIEAGSSGKPNMSAEINNLKLMLPFLIQMPHIDSMELAREMVRRLDDRLDLTKIITKGAMSVVAQNRMAMTAPGDAGDPSMQGGAGGANAEAPPGQESPGGAPTMGGPQVGA